MVSIFSDLRRGVLMKVGGILAKALFVLYFSTSLMPGEFGRYFYFFSIAVIVSRVLGLGADDELPFKVKGQPEVASAYMGVGLLYVFLAVILVPGAFLVSRDYLLVLFSLIVSLLLAASSFSVGALRSVDNLFQEIRSNVPWMLVCFLLMIAPIRTAEQIVAYVVASYFLVQLYEGRLAAQKSIKRPAPQIRVLLDYLGTIKSWLPKSVSTAAMAASLRSFPLWVGLASKAESDRIAYAFAIGEVSYQLCMTYVNLVHSRVSRHGSRSSMKSFLMVVGVFLAVSVLLSLGASTFLRLFGMGTVRGLDFMMILAAALYACSIAVFSLVRIFVWNVRSATNDWGLVAVQFLLFLVPGVLLWYNLFSGSLVFIAAGLNLIIVVGYYYSSARKGG